MHTRLGRFARRVAMAGLLACPPVAQAGTAVAVGTEYMEWREYHPMPILEETGFRPFIQLDFSPWAAEGRSLDMAGRLYGGEVAYNGQLMDGTPLKATSSYSGIIAEAGGAWALAGLPGDGLSLVARAGVDWWERVLNGASGYTERYRLVYLRFGAEEAGPPGRWSARGGVLLPLSVHEQVNLGGGLKLQPKGRPGFYLDFARRTGPAQEIGVGFRRYRFDTSEPTAADIDGDGRREWVLQPNTQVDVWTIFGRFGL